MTNDYEKILTEWRNDPVRFYRDMWGDKVVLWDRFEETARAIAANQRVVVRSGHGVGKTNNMAHLALWFLYCFTPAKVITTAPTWQQVEKLLWSEIKTAHGSAAFPLGGKVLSTEIKLADDWFAVGISTREDISNREFGATRFQGFHSPNLLVIIDEAAGVAEEITTACESLIVSENNRIVMIGNPASPRGAFFEACKSPLWHKIVISCFDHPNVKTGQDLIPGAVTRAWVEDKRTRWGEGSPLWKAKVIGEFPDEGDDTLIPLSWVEQAMANTTARNTGARRLACDVARFGNDETVFGDAVGDTVMPLDSAVKRDTMWTVGQIMHRIKGNEYDAIIIDDGGVGGGVVDRLEELGVDVTAVNFGSKPNEPDLFVCKRDEMYWNLREALKPDEHGVVNARLPDDKELANQLCSIRYSYNSAGKIKIESKDEMKKRGLKSPDRADAVAMLFAYSSHNIDDGGGITVIENAADETADDE